MRIVQINSTCGIGSTGRICVEISHLLNQKSVENYIFYSAIGIHYENGIRLTNKPYLKVQALKARIFGNYGCNSNWVTRKIINKLECIKPDIVHLQNIHSHDCNIEILFHYLKSKKIKVIWTFHDCWAFTGYCPHFTMVKCNKWQTACSRPCIQRREFSWLFDQGKKMFEKKKRLLANMDLTIVTPSKWLAGIVKQSFLKDYPVEIINNGIDLSIFHYSPGDFRSKYQLEGKKIILGVSFDWGKRKGLDVFEELARTMSDDYRVVLVGTDENIDKSLNKKIISIHRTGSQSELAEIYSSANVFVNPTREDNYPTVNMEALACGTPVVTFNTGGSPEMIDNTCGSVVDCDEFTGLRDEIIRVCENTPYSRDDCIAKAIGFDKNERYKEYIALYERVVAARNETN